MRKGNLRSHLQQAGKFVKGTVKATGLLAGVLLLGKPSSAQTTTFSYTGSIQSYTVPAGVTTATITCKGAQGGNSTSPSQSGGQGAIMSGVFTVTPGHVLNILVGQQPASCQYNAGGGGGSFVWDVTASNTLLIAAGGGGGANGNVGSGVNGLNASTGTSGVLGGNATGGAGTGGNGASNPTGSSFWGGGGAGWNSNGANGTSGGCALTSIGGTKPLSGGAGGAQGGTNIAPPNGNGGFGGGGGGQGLCGNTGGAGGGGGYSGGTSGTVPSATQAQPGGGGGSFNSGSSQSNSVGNTGNGQVTIATPVTLLSISSVSPGIANPGSSVTISGANFSSTPGNNLVTFGGALASVTSASTSSLTVTVPTGAFYAPVSVTNTVLGQTAYELAQQFLPTWSGPAPTVSFNSHVDFTNSGLAGIAIGDLDGDGKPDMVVSKQGSNIVQVYMNTSTSGSITTGSFAAPVSFGAGSGPAFVAIADMDGDGKPEIIASDFGSNTVAVLRNTATAGVINSGSFASAVTFSVGSSPEGIAVGDLNGDGKPDLAVLNQTLGTMSLLQNTSSTGTISFNPQVVFSTGSVPFSISISDVDGDGWPDIVQTNFNSNNFKVFRNTGAGGTISAGTLGSPSSFTANFETIGLAVVDIDGDGKQDVVVSNFGSANLSVFLNTSTSGSVSFAPKVDIGTLTAPIELGVADINGDGKPDIISGQGSGGTQVSYFPNTSTSGSVSFGTRMNMAAGINPEWLTVGDLDGDGKADIAVVNVSGTAGTSVIRNASLFNNAPTFTGGSPQNLNVCQNSTNNDINSLLTISDLDAGQTETWTVISGPSHGSVATGPTQTSTGGSVTPTGFSYTPNATYYGPDAFVVQVSDGMGGTSSTTINVTVNPMPAAITGPSVVCVGSTIILSSTSGGGVWTSSNSAIASVGTGSGTVSGVALGSATITYTLTGNCFVTDAINVGALPTVTSISPTSGIPGNSVTINGTNFNTTSSNDIVYFGATQATVTSASSTSMTVTIPNGSVYYPVVSVENNTCALMGWAPYPFIPTYNNAAFIANTTNFDAPVTYATNSFPNQMTYGDVDGDGKTDIIVSNYNTGTILAYRNTSVSGTISFAAPVTVLTTTTSALGRPSMGDIDGDGKLDIVYTTAIGPAVMGVLRNTSTPGSITFAAPVTVVYVTNGDCTALADIDGDGRLDVIANYLGNMSIFRNTSSVGSISFAGRVDFGGIPGNVLGIIAGNIDGDTKPDIALSLNNGTTSLSVYRNTSTPGTISLAARQDFTTLGGGNGGPTTVRLADMDGDGKQDILMSSSGNVCIFPNTSTVGSITLGTRVDVAGVGGGSLSIGDFDGDGRPDVVTSSAGPVGVLLNTSSGAGSFTFAAGAKFSSGTLSSGVVAADLDGDKIADIAVTEQSANRLSLFRNDPLHPITGTLTACPTSTTTLSDATPGGKWVSGTPGVATVGSSTGIVTGVSTGTAVISYVGTASTLTSSNITTVTVTINPNPSGITGTPNVCTGATTLLADGTAGGNWSSSNSAIASVTGGTVSGNTAGVATMSYTLSSTGCYATVPVTVNQTPTPISGSFTVCVSGSTTLTDGYSGGTWTSSAPGVALIGSTTGILSGVTPGNSTIVYTMPGNCSVSQQITVNSNPSSVSGTSNICVGTSTTLTDATSGGLWSSSAPSVATITPGSGLVVGAAAGTTTMSYTLSSTGCYAIFPMTVNANPVAITGASSVCQSLTTVLSDATPGGTWSSSSGSASVTSGTVTGVSAGTATISYTIPSTGCFATEAFTVNPNPVAISGTLSVCVGSTTVLSDATGTGSWSSSDISQASIGSGTGVVTGNSGPSNPIVTYTLPTGCLTTTTLTVNPLPANITGTFTACPGTSATLSSTSGGGTWTSNNTAVATIGSTTGTYTGVTSGISTITYTLPTGCFTTATITINPNPAAITGTASVCVGATTTLADGTGGGTWSTTAGTGSVTVGATTGVVTGVTAGNAAVTYTLGTGCIATTTATVNAPPATIPTLSTPTTFSYTGTIQSYTVPAGITSIEIRCAGAQGGNGWTVGGQGAIMDGFYSVTPGHVLSILVGQQPATVAQSGGGGGGSFVWDVTAGNTLLVAAGGGGGSGGNGGSWPGVNASTGINGTASNGTWSTSGAGTAGNGATIPTGTVFGFYAGGGAGWITGGNGGFDAFVCSQATGGSTPLGGGAGGVLGGTPGQIGNGGFGGGGGGQGQCTYLGGGGGGGYSGGGAGVYSGGGPSTAGGGGGGGSFSIGTSQSNSVGNTGNGSVTISVSAPATVCVGSTITLTDGTAGGSWTSSNTAVATVGSGSGVVTGVTAGTATISYTLPTGCFSTAAITVNPTPAAIAGSNNVCMGATTTLTDATSGGTWSSSNTAVGSIGSASGIVSGSTAGTINITYTLPAGCTAVMPFTINTTPAAIGGTFTVCTGTSTSLTDATAGGTWTSSNTGLATVGSTGSPTTLTGVSAGVPVITYTLPAGSCSVTQAVTVNTTPPANTGTATVCVGLTTTLANAVSGGTWSSLAPAIATVGATTGVVTGGPGTGTASIVYTVGGCTATTVVTVNPQPAAIGGTPAVCTGQTTVLTDATAGGSWSSSNTAVATVSGGTVSGVTAGTAIITYTLPAGCFVTQAVTVNQSPSAITGNTNLCIGASNTMVNSIGGGTWTISNSNASIGATSGVAVASSVGTSIITYTLPGGCFSTLAVSENAQPAAITGTFNVCVGSTRTLTDASSPGSWSSSNVAIAGVSGVGVVSGNSAGVANITFTLTAGGCTSVQSFTVNPQPAAIGGTPVVCVGSTTTLTETTTGGTWTSTNSAQASVGSTGIVTGNGVGNPVISYTLLAGCASSVTMTVNPTPTVFAVTGGGSYCSGGSGVTIGLSGSTSGVNYQLWRGTAPIGGPVAGTGSAIGFGSQTVAGTYTVVATNATTGCTANMGGSATVSVSPLPTPFNVTGGGAYCSGGSGVHVFLSGSVLGTNYTLYNGSTAVTGATPGLGFSIDFGLFTAAGTYTVQATVASTGCTAGMTGSATITVNPLPTAYAMTGGGSYCSGTSGVNVGLAASDVGISYQLFNSGTPVGSPMPGTGAALSFGLQTAAGTYTIVGTNVVTSCVGSMTGTAVVTISPLPTVYSVSGGGGYCSGGTGVNVGLSGSNTGINYQLWRGGVYTGTTIAGAGGSFNFGLQTVAGTYTVVAINATTSCSVNMSGSATVTVNPLPTVFNVTGGGSYCAGGTGVHIGLNGSTIGVSYQLYNGTGTTVGGPVAGTSIALDFGLITPASTYTVVATNATTGCTSNMSGSATVNINPLPTPYAVTGGGSYCVGGTGVDIGLSNSDAGVTYQLYNGITPVGLALSGGAGALDFGLQTAAGTYTVIGTITATSCNTPMSGSAVVSVNPLPAAFNVTGGGSYCAGGTGVVVGLSNSVIGVNYQLQVGGVNVAGAVVAGTGSAITFAPQTTAGTYTVVAADGLGCTNNMTGSVTININPLPTVYSVTGGGGYCTGGTGAHIGLGNSNIGFTYQLYFGSTAIGSPMAGTNAPLDFGLFTGVGTYTVSATNTSTGCTTGMASSATIGTIGLPAIAAVTGGGNICAGGPGLSISVSPSAVGTNYQLYRGTTAVGAALPGNGGSLPFPAQSTAGNYTVVATNGSGCTATMAGSATITVNPLPNIYIVSGGGGYCAGGTGVTVGLSNSDIGVNYQLFNPGPVLPIVAGTGAALTLGTETTAGIYTVVATNAGSGCSRSMSGSATVSINPLPGSAFTVTGGGSYCTGGAGVPVGLSASELGVNYQLYNGTSPVGTIMPGTTGAIGFGLQTLPGTYTVNGTNASTGCTSTMTSSVTVTINALPTAYAVTGGGNYCPGGTGVTVGVNNSDAGTSYQLFLGGVAVPGAVVTGTGTAISFGPQTALGSYTVVATSGPGCTNSMTGSATIANYPVPALHSVTGGGSYCAGGTGVAIGLNGSDAGISYQLMSAGAPVGLAIPGTGSAVTFGPETVSGIYTVEATNMITGCVDTMLDSAVININSLPIAQTLTGGGVFCSGTTGVDVATGSSEIGVSYQLNINGVPSGSLVPGTGFGLDFGIHTAPGVYTIVGINITTLCSTSMANADTISVNVPPTAYSVTGGGNYCSGGAGVHVGLSNSQSGVNYTLYNGATPAAPAIISTGGALDFGPQTAPGIYTVRALNPATGCSNTMLSSATVAINALPTAYAVTGGGGYCTGTTTGVHVGLGGSAAGIRYQLYNGTSPVGSAVAGTGSALDFGVFTATGTYTVNATNPTTGCVGPMTGTAVVTVNALPAAYTVSGSSTSYCAGGTGINVYLSGSQSGVSYQLYRGTTPVGIAIPGSTTALDFGAQTIAGTYTVKASNTSTSCANTMTGSATVNINPLPGTFGVVGGGNYCPGGTGVHVGLSGSASGVKYQLYIGGSTLVGTAVNGTGSAIDFGLKTTTGNYTVVATNATTGCTANMTGSATIGLNPVPTAFAVTGGGAFCSGGGGVNVGLSGSVTGTNYQLYFGSTPLGGSISGTGTSITFGPQTFAGTYTVVATDATSSCTNNMSGSAIVVENALPNVYIVTGGGNYCAGGSGVHVKLANSDTGVNYQLYYGSLLSGSPVSGTGSMLDFGVFTGVGTYMVTATNRTTHCVSTMSGGATVGLNTLPTVYSVVGGGSYCDGGTGVHVGLSGSSSGISYQLFKNSAADGLPVIGSGTPVDFGPKTDSGAYTVVATNNSTTCTSNMTGLAMVLVNPVVTPTLSVSTGGPDSACAGNNVTFSAIATGTGGSPTYQWSVNGAVAASGSSYTYAPANNDVVSVTMVSSAACAAPASLSSSVTMTVLPKLMPSVDVTAIPGTIVCRGSIVNFTATPTAGGAAPTYLWLKNGLHVGTSATFTDVPSDGDIIYCQMTSNYYCPLTPTVSSMHITMEVDTPVTPSVSISVNPGLNIYPGESETFTAHLASPVPYPTYKWYVDGTLQPAFTTPTFTSETLTDMDVVTCEVTTGGGCAGQTSSASVTVHVMNVGVKPVITSSIDVKLLPNPNKGAFTIKGSLGTLTDDEVTVEVSDMLGQIVFKDKVIAHNGNLDQRIQLTSVANGMYLVTVHTADANAVFHMVVEQ